MCPKNWYVEALTPGPKNATVFGDKAIMEEIKVK